MDFEHFVRIMRYPRSFVTVTVRPTWSIN